MTDVVSGGAEPTSRRTRTLLVAAALLAVLAVGADRWWADRERDRLAEAVAGGEEVVDEAEASLVALRGYIAPSAERPDLPAGGRARAYGPVGRDAERWLPRVQRQLDQVRAADVLPWHGDLAGARDAYAARLQEVVNLLAAVARAPAESAGEPEQSAASRDAAIEALRAAGLDLPD